MSRKTIRAAVVDWFTAPPIPGLDAVYPTAMRDTALLPASGTTVTGSRASGFVWIVDDKERRVATPAVAGVRLVDYTVHLQIVHLSWQVKEADAADDLDTLVEAVKARLRSDPRLGQTPDVIFEAAQGKDPQIEGFYGEPQALDNGAIETWFAIGFTVSEQITA